MPKIQCECKRVLSYRSELAGKFVKCPGCSAKIRLPAAEPAHPTTDKGQDLQLERNEADIPLAASMTASESTAPSGFPQPSSQPLVWPAARRSAGATSRTAAADQDYWSVLPGAFSFPLQGEGLIALAIGVIILTVVNFLGFVPFGFMSAGMIPVGAVIGIGVSAAAIGYVAGYLMTIMERTAHGEKDAPAWPDPTDWQETLAKPFFFVLALSVLCIGPSIAYRYLAHEPQPAVRYLILVAGLFYMPMGMLCVALANDFAGLSPIRVIRGIFSVPGRYLIAWVLVAVSVAAEILGRGLIAQMPIPIIGTLLQHAVSCYFLFVAARILGLLYYKSGPQLDWLAG